MTPERARPIFDLTCQYPDLIINNRLGGGVLGDTATPEQRIATDPLGRQFEVCMTINNSWGYNASDTRWKSAQQLDPQPLGHRQQGRELPLERRADGRGHHSRAGGRAA